MVEAAPTAGPLMRAVWCCVVATFAACGRIHFDVANDTMIPADAPWGTGPFGSPVLVSELSVAGVDDDDPTLTGDELEIIFNSARMFPPKLFRAVRASRTDPWGPPELITELLGATGEDTTPEISADGLTL